ncbi:MAG: hypothetical protein IJJ77_01215, partial [Paludibacteraceae bacterium]|nr:hypothetical protein [Paludibacteraceae bacterium]
MLFALGDECAILRYSLPLMMAPPFDIRALPLMNFPSIIRHSLRISGMRCIINKGANGNSPLRTGELLFALGDECAILRYSLPL